MMLKVIYFAVLCSVSLVILGLWVFNRRRYRSQLLVFPKVSILIAARNEEHTILRCLKAIERLDYPRDKIEVLIGDDASTDNTYRVVRQFIQDKPQFKCVTITQNMGMARGKGNVLAHLAHMATSNYFFITDADILVPPSWIQIMMAHVRPYIGIVTGITTVKGPRLFDKLQSIDWIHALGLFQVVTDLDLPVFTMGNNMLITREAYEATGGYENISFSVTEDAKLYQEVVKKHFHTVNIFDESVLALSTPAQDMGQLLRQRRRWMEGISHIPFYMSAIFILYSCFYPIWIPFFQETTPLFYWGILVAKVAWQTVFIWLCARRVNLKFTVWQLIIYEFFMMFLGIASIIYYILPVKITWKQRKYA
jgi:cellulose synthase/poly-beta-1,6-N-acetylglucosamine synthase-like glycosyltransferase